MSEYLPLPEGFFVVWRVTLGNDPRDETRAAYVRADPFCPDPAGAIVRAFPELSSPRISTYGHRWSTAHPYPKATGTIKPHGAESPWFQVDELEPVEVWHAAAPLWAGAWERWEGYEREDLTLLKRNRFYATTPEALYERAVQLAEACPEGGPQSYDRLAVTAPDGTGVTVPVYGRRAVPGWTPRGPESMPVRARVTIPVRSEGLRPDSARIRYYRVGLGAGVGVSQPYLVRVDYRGVPLEGTAQEVDLTPMEEDAEVRRILTPGRAFELYGERGRLDPAAYGVVV